MEKKGTFFLSLLFLILNRTIISSQGLTTNTHLGKYHSYWSLCSGFKHYEPGFLYKTSKLPICAHQFPFILCDYQLFLC